ncbi:MAG TPA: arginine repressor [Blastocatellia bacterium]|nr:arginine repressor [Blastocatellia bacterium]
MKSERLRKIVEIVGKKRVATQQELAEELRRRGIESTQSSISRDIVELGLIKVNGYYAAPQPVLAGSGPIVDIDTAGDNLIVVKTDVGQAQPVAVRIDGADIEEIVGTVAGDDTILIAVKNASAQRAAMKKILKLFAAARARPADTARRASRSAGRSLFFR